MTLEDKVKELAEMATTDWLRGRTFRPTEPVSITWEAYSACLAYSMALRGLRHDRRVTDAAGVRIQMDIVTDVWKRTIWPERFS